MTNILDSRNVPDAPTHVIHTSEELQEIMFAGMIIFPIAHDVGAEKTYSDPPLRIIETKVDNEDPIGPRITVVEFENDGDNKPCKIFVDDMFHRFKCVALTPYDHITMCDKIDRHIKNSRRVQDELTLECEMLEVDAIIEYMELKARCGFHY